MRRVSEGDEKEKLIDFPRSGVFAVGWHHYNFPDQLYNSTPPTTSLYQPQPDSTSSAIHHPASGDVAYYNNSTDSSDYVTTTSSHSLTAAANGNMQSNTLSSGTVSFQQRRGSLQLWQFLIALLDEPSSK